MPADLSDPAAPQTLWRSIEERGLTIDALVNNAGYGIPGHALDAEPILESRGDGAQPIVTPCREHEIEAVRREDVGNASPIPAEAPVIRAVFRHSGRPPPPRASPACDNSASMFRRGRIHRLLIVPILLCAGVLVPAVAALAAQSPAAAPCDIRTPERIVAVGDVHGAYDRFVGILRAAGVIDGRQRWIGGRTVLVQTGDVLDRGADSRRVLDLLRRLEREATGAGGRVYALLGNHEVMRMIADWRYLSPDEIAAFRTSGSEEVRERVYGAMAAEAAKRARDEKQAHDEAGFRERFMKNVPLGLIEMQQAFGPSGDYGKWLRERYALVRINGIAFVHGGIDTATAILGCEGINEAARRDVATPQPTPEQLSKMLVTSETGPLWYRGLATEPDPAFAPQVAAILRALGARAIVVGHTVTNGLRIRPRFGGRVVTIDTGMLGGTWYPGGVASALEIRGDALTAIYEKEREPLPALAATVPESR